MSTSSIQEENTDVHESSLSNLGPLPIGRSLKDLKLSSPPRVVVSYSREGKTNINKQSLM